MAIAISNQIENHRCVYFEAVGDGATTALPSITHTKWPRPNHTIKVFAVTGPTKASRRSERGGCIFPEDGTALTVTSASVSSSGVLSITISPAIGNGTKAFCVAVFDQHTN